ncbi:MAG: hypothetical protein ACK4GN_00790 [Runella sp.]
MNIRLLIPNILSGLFLCAWFPLHAQRDTTRFDQWIFMVTPTSAINPRLSTLEMGVEYNPKGYWGYGLNVGFVGRKTDRFFKQQSHQVLRFDVKHYFRRQVNATFTALEVMLFHINHNGDGTSYIGNRNEQNLPIVKTTFNEYNGKVSFKIGRRISADIWRIEWFLGMGLQKRNVWYRVNEVTSQIAEFTEAPCMMLRCVENYYLTDTKGFWGGGFLPNVSLGLKIGFILKTKKIE